MITDVGLTHVALMVSDLDRSLAFYDRYCAMRPVHQRAARGGRVAWISDLTRPFVVVLIEGDLSSEARLGPLGHLGVGCESRARVDELTAIAAAEGCLRLGPIDSPPPVGYWAYLDDPDGHTVELTHGQEVGLTVLEHIAPAQAG